MSSGPSENGAMNNAFLVLNLGNNTVGFANHGMFLVPQVAFQPPPVDSNNSPSMSAAATVMSASTSTEERSEASAASGGSGGQASGDMISNQPVEKSDDPDRKPKKKARKSRAKSKLGPAASENPSEPAMGGAVVSSGAAQPPPHLLRLLTLFGWRVIHRPWFQDFVYITPQGEALHSISKVLEVLMDSYSKYKERSWVASGIQGTSGLGDGSIAMQSSSAADDSGAEVRRAKRKPVVEQNAQPCAVVEPGLQQEQVIVNGSQSSLSSKMACPGQNTEVSPCTAGGRTTACAEDGCSLDATGQVARGSSCQPCNSNRQQDGKCRGARRTGRSNRKNVRSQSLISDAGANKNGLSTDNINPNAVMVEVEKFPGSQADGLLDMDTSTNDRSRKCMPKGSKPAGSRRSRQRGFSKESIMDSTIDVQSMVSTTKSGLNVDARKNDLKIVAAESNFHENVIDKKLSRANMFDSNNLLCQPVSSDIQCHKDAPRMRRSTHMKGKHVPVDNELYSELGFDNDIPELFDYATNRVVMDNQHIAVSSEADGIENGVPLSDMKLGRTIDKKTNCQSLTMCMMESCNSKESRNENSSRYKLSCIRRANNEIRMPDVDKCYPSAPNRKKAGSDSATHEKSQRHNRRCTLIARRNSTNVNSKDALSETKYTILSWLIHIGILMEKQKVAYVPRITGNVLCGLITKRGIRCDCCKEVVPLLVFEAHAGCELQQPWENILLMSGKPLLKCLQEAWDQEKKTNLLGLQKVGADDPDPSDDTCGICADGGHLICCDSCPSTFHQECLMLKALPEGLWNCPYCQCAFCMAVDNGLQGGITTLDMFTCQQCQHKYHENCPSRNRGCEMGSYCSENCKKLASQLSDMVGVMNHIEDGFSWVLLKLQKDEAVNSNKNLSVVLECNLKLAIALAVLKECFLPLIDRRTGIDMLCQAVYSHGSNFKRLNYEGFYTMVLQKDGEIISAALLRFHGTKLAEMPFVGTLPAYQRQGMCHRLLKALEQVLASLQVEKLVIPAIPDLVQTWKRSFSFRPLGRAHTEEVKNLSLLIFPETTLLHTSISIRQAAQEGCLPVGKVNIDKKSTDQAKDLHPPGGELVSRHDSRMMQLTDDELAALEMEHCCSFTALLTGNLVPQFYNSNLSGSFPAALGTTTRQYLPTINFVRENSLAPGSTCTPPSQMSEWSSSNETNAHNDTTYPGVCNLLHSRN